MQPSELLTRFIVSDTVYLFDTKLRAFSEVGEVWANILHNVYAALVGQYGWSSVAKTNPDGTEGNVVYLHLLMDALRLQPCNPTCKYKSSLLLVGIANLMIFVVIAARAAWIQADANRYGGANKCLLWKAFASRGLGVNAANHVDDATLPEGC